MSLAARRGRPGGASGSGSQARVPAQHARPVPAGDLTPETCRSLPAQNAGTGRRVLEEAATQNAGSEKAVPGREGWQWRSQRAFQPSHAAELYWAAGSPLP